MFVSTLMLFLLVSAGKYSLNETLIEPTNRTQNDARKYNLEFKSALPGTDVAKNHERENEENNVIDERLFKNAEDNSEIISHQEEFHTVSNKLIETTLQPKQTSKIPFNGKQIPIGEKLTNRTKRKYIKLNMKQGLLMNQVLGIYALDDAHNSLCRNHSLEFKEGLRSFEPWALKMFDSSSKLQSGILVGNLMEFGSFKQCINVYFDSKYGAIRGQQCTLKIEPTMNIIQKVLSFRGVSKKRFKLVRSSVEGASIFWSVCVPDSCNVEDILQHFTKYIKSVGQGLDLNVTLNDIDCFALKDQPPITYKEYTVIALAALLLSVTGMCTLFDLINQNKNQKNGKFVDTFSFLSNASYVFNYSTVDKTGFGCLHGIRFLSIAYVIVGHRFLMTLFVPSVNALDLMDWLLKYSSTIIIGGTVSVDTFFMLSGLLVAYYTMEQLSMNRGKLNWFLFYLHRYIRLTPPLGVVVLIYATVIQHFGSGPLWLKTVAILQKPCQYFWWSALLHVQNYVNSEYLCILQTWYLTCDMFFYLFSPLLIYPLWKYPKFGWINFTFIYVISVGVNFYLAWINKYGAGMLVTTQLISDQFFLRHYILPHVRSSPFILGVGMGAIFQKTKHMKIKMNPITVSLGWLWSSVLILTTILGNHTFQLENHDFNVYEHSAFISMSRSAWVFGVLWIVWACKHGYGGPVNHFLSHPIFQVFGKITYSLFLWHMSIQFLNNGALKLPIYFSDFSVVYKYLGDLGVSISIALLFTIMIECPSVKIARNIFSLSKEK